MRCHPTACLPLLACLALALAAPAAAEVLTWSADAPFAAGNTVAVDFGAALDDVTSLEAVATGMGGEQLWIIYQGIGNPTGSVPFEMFLECRDGGPALAGSSLWLPLMAPFSGNLVFAPADDWSWLADGRFDLAVSYVHAPFPDNPFCYGYGYTLPEVAHLDVIVTCAQAVPAAVIAWGSAKAMYR